MSEMRPTLHPMKIFVRAVEANSFMAAARSLLIDPAIVSRTIKALESELGAILFKRSTRSLKLTPEGVRFYRDCVQLLKKFEETTQQFRIDGAIVHGRLKVGVAPAMPRRALLQAILPFPQQYPKIELVLLSIDDVAEVENKSIDVLVRGRALRQRGALRPVA